MRFADLFVSCALVLLFVVIAAPPAYRLVRRPGHWPAGARRTLWIGALCAAALLLGQFLVVDRVADLDGPTPADLAALDRSVAHRVGWAIGIGRLLAWIGGPAAMAVLAAVAVVWLWRRGAGTAVLLVVAATGLGAVALINGFKHLYARSRPPPEVQVIQYLTHSLPSGHALGSTVVVGMVVAAALLRHSPGTVRKPGLVTAGVLFVLAVGLSRVYLGAHWLTDVLTGWLLGGAWLAVGVTALVLLRPPRPDITHTGVKASAAG